MQNRRKLMPGHFYRMFFFARFKIQIDAHAVQPFRKSRTIAAKSLVQLTYALQFWAQIVTPA